MFLYDHTNEAMSNDAYDDKYAVHCRYGNPRWLDHDWMLSMLHSGRKADH